MNLKKRMICAVLAALLCIAALACAVGADSQRLLLGTDISSDDGSRPWHSVTEQVYTYDFASGDMLTYANDPVLACYAVRTNMIFEDGVLKCKPDGDFAIGSTGFLGDDYGLYGGSMSVDVQYSGGTLAVGTRLSKQAATPEYRGIWFTIARDRLSVTAPGCGLSAELPLTMDGEHTLRVTDACGYVTLAVDERVVTTVKIGDLGELYVLDAEGENIGSGQDTELRDSGYFSIYASDLEGALDNLIFTHRDVTVNLPEREVTDVDYSNWVATDDLDRTTPEGDGSDKGKQVGVFYFLCWSGDSGETVKDNTAIYLEKGLDGLTEHLADLRAAGGYYWAEPYFGYYRNTDEWIYRKHAYMLESAGVDFIYIDVTNGVTYPEGLIPLFETWLQIRREGNATPDICFIMHSSVNNSLSQLRGTVYADENWDRYSELFYNYQGKPLILADLDVLDAKHSEFIEKFTVRDCWAWTDEDGSWSWLQEYRIKDGKVELVNGGWGRDLAGNQEALALCIGHHPTTSKGRSYANTVFPEVRNDYGFSLDSGLGTGMTAQFEAISQLDPDIMLITGWNEWVAGLNRGEAEGFAGMKKSEFYFVDQFNTEYSRDAEPMKIRQGETSVGFGDNYYYQMASIIREFKGWGTVKQASGQGTVDMTDPNGFASVGPEYRDNTGDIALRSEIGFFGAQTYVNNTGRNDFACAKVSQDDTYLYFTVECENGIIVDDGANWMNLYLDVDGDATNGWEGYDYVINRARDRHYASVESLENGWDGRHTAQALYTVNGSCMTVRVQKSLIGIEGHAAQLCFKWADNSTLTGNVMEFMDLGDTAPNDRYAYLYRCEIQDLPTRTETYALAGKDGQTEPMRDESLVLPGFESSIPGGADGPVSVVQRLTYSPALKWTIVLCGGVIGACAFVSISAIGRMVAKKKGKG